MGKECSIDLISMICGRNSVPALRNWCQSPAAGSFGPDHGSPIDDPSIFGADAGRGRGAVGVRGDGADGGGYFQPVTRGELSRIFGKEVSRDAIAAHRGAGFLASGTAQPDTGAPTPM